MTNLYLIRHGEGTNNLAGGAIVNDGPLTALGVRQAERLRDRLAATREITADALIASTMLRARQTAEIIAPALGPPQRLPLLLDPELEERRMGQSDGLSLEEAERRWPPAAGATPHQEWSADPTTARYPGSESPHALTARVSRALARITEEHAGKTVVVVCHGGVIANALLYFAGLDTAACFLTAMFPLPEHRALLGRPWLFGMHSFANTSITHWRLATPPAGPPVWDLVTFNDSLHLRDLRNGRRIDWSAFAAGVT